MVDFTYLNQPPRKFTFEQPKLKLWTESWCFGKVLNLFAGKTKLHVDELRIDSNVNMNCDIVIDAFDFVNIYKGKPFDTVIYDPPYCYDKDTEILTNKGWKYFKDLDKSEKVATLNPKTHFLEYHKPTDYIKTHYNGDMIKIKSGNIDLVITPNHNLYIRKIWKTNKFNLVEAKDINYGFKFKSDCKWNGNEQKYFILPEVKFIKTNRYGKTKAPERKIEMDIWLRFFGIYLAEGCVDPLGTNYRVRIAQTKIPNRKIIEKWIKDTGYHYLVGKNEFTIYNKQLCVYLRQFKKAKEKFIPQELKELSKRQLNILLESMALGDGHKHERIRWNEKYQKNYIERHFSYSSYSKKLLDDVFEISLKIGYAPVIRKDGTTINISKHRRSSVINKKNLKEYLTKIKYNDNVYCVNVPNNIIYVRRNKKQPVWCGNSYRKSMEKYKGKTVSSHKKIKDILSKVIKPSGRIISFGYDSVGMSKSRGFKKIAICLVCHNGAHNDTICLVESKIDKDLKYFF